MSYDPFEDAVTQEPDVWFGQVCVEAWQGFFQTGVGATPYDENVHGERKHYLIIHFEFIPIDVTRKAFSRHMGKWALEYKEVLLPSLEALTDEIAHIKGLFLGQFNFMREADGMYFQCLRVSNPDNKEGENWTAMKFEEVYPDEAACVAAWEEHDGKEIGGSQVADLPFMPDESDPLITNEVLMDQFRGIEMTAAEVKAATSEPQRASMAAFLPALWEQAAGDMIKMQNLLDANRMVGQHFTVESPEVVEVMNG